MESPSDKPEQVLGEHMIWLDLFYTLRQTTDDLPSLIEKIWKVSEEDALIIFNHWKENFKDVRNEDVHKTT